MNRPTGVRAAAVLLAASVGLGVLLTAPAAAAPAPDADYRFQHNLSSSVPGAPNLQNINAAGTNTFVGTGARTALAFPEGNGLRLLNANTVMGRGVYTIAVRARYADVSDYGRVLNFKQDTHVDSDTGLYVVRDDLRFYDLSEGENDILTPNTYVTIVLTRSATNMLRGYVNGALQWAVADPDGYGRLGSHNVLRFFKDDSNGEETAGRVRRIRIWDSTLTAAQVATL